MTGCRLPRPNNFTEGASIKAKKKAWRFADRVTKAFRIVCFVISLFLTDVALADAIPHTTYDWRGNATQIRREGPGNPQYYYKTFSYNTRGELYNLQNGDNTGEGWSYDGNGNVTLHEYSETGEEVPIPEGNSYTYDGSGRLTAISNGTVGQDISFTYDDGDRATQMVDASGTTTWSYFGDDQINQITTPQGNTQNYYDGFGRLQKIRDAGSTDYDMEYAYDAAGRVQTITKFGETTNLRNHDDYEDYINDPYWQNHEVQHLVQEQEMGTTLFLIEIGREYFYTWPHDNAPLEIDADNNSGDPDKSWREPWSTPPWYSPR